MKSRPFGFRLATVFTTVVLVALQSSTAIAGTKLPGRVLTQGGSPIAKANVYIYTAVPRVGTSAYCPS